MCRLFQEIRKKKGIKEEVQLTSKQKENVQLQLERESTVRKRLQGVRQRALTPPTTSLLKASTLPRQQPRPSSR